MILSRNSLPFCVFASVWNLVLQSFPFLLQMQYRSEAGIWEDIYTIYVNGTLRHFIVGRLRLLLTLCICILVLVDVMTNNHVATII